MLTLKTLYKILAVLLIIFALWNGYVFLFSNHETELAMSGVIENSVGTDGYIIKNETLIKSDVSGMVKAYFNEGEKVSKGRRVVSVVSGELSEQAQSELASVNKRIAQIKANSAFDDDLLSVDGQIDSVIKPVDTVFMQYDELVLNDKKAKLFLNGVKMRATQFDTSNVNTENVRVYNKNREFLGLASLDKKASKIASEIWSQTLSGCPSVTDSDVNKYFDIYSLLF